ncbi:hypothetical protein D3C72_1906110 [compost metagenome]
MPRNAQDLGARLRRFRGGVDADDAVGAAIRRETDHHASLRAARDRADHDVIEFNAELGFLCTHFLRKPDKTQTA